MAFDSPAWQIMFGLCPIISSLVLGWSSSDNGGLEFYVGQVPITAASTYVVGQGPITAALTYVVGQGPITATSIIILSLRSWLIRISFPSRVSLFHNLV